MKVEIPSLEALYNKYTSPKVGDWIEVVKWDREYEDIAEYFEDGDRGEVVSVIYEEVSDIYEMDVYFHKHDRKYIVFWGKDKVKIIRRDDES